MIRRHRGDFTWDGVDVLPYKETGTHFKSVTRQVLARAEGEMNAEFRYFEVGPGGHSTLERHEHQHVVVILRGAGRALIDGRVQAVGHQDVVHIPAMSWHQFQAGDDEPLGFLCVVGINRDRPQLPNPDDLALLRSDPEVASFIKV